MVDQSPKDNGSVLRVLKRGGKLTQDFDESKIARAIQRAFDQVWGKSDKGVVQYLTKRVKNRLSIENNRDGNVPVEHIQDTVETVLMVQGCSDVAKAYILYRSKKSEIRTTRLLPDPSAISDYIHPSKYARYLGDKKRREVYSETVSRVENMHLSRFPSVREEITEAFDMVRDKKLLPSMRSMQFAGPAILQKEARLFNCSFMLIDKIRAFGDSLYLLLCGCGVGYSIQQQHIDKLPELKSVNTRDVRHHTISDDIEGWADALTALMRSYELGYYVEFDYSQIRHEGAPLKISGGKAPGHLGLKKSLDMIRDILNGSQGRKLRSIECYDIMCLAADAVLSGGIRRSATIALFSPHDGEMKAAKTGQWWQDTPWRANSNNSVVHNRNVVKREQFRESFRYIKEFGEPGNTFTENNDYGWNPCCGSFTPVLTPDGLSTFGALKVGDKIWSAEGWTVVVRKWATGIKDVYRYRTTSGVFYGTDKHRIVSGGEKVEVGTADSIDSLRGPEVLSVVHTPQIVMDGLVLGDGSRYSKSTKQLFIGDGDTCYFDSEINSYIGKKCRSNPDNIAYKVESTLSYEELVPLPERRVPKRYLSDYNSMASFLRGLYSANGSVVRHGTYSGRVTLKTTSAGLVEDVQIMLSALGIHSYFTTNKPKRVKFSNGEYECKESYDVNISTDRGKFLRTIGFIHPEKMAKLEETLEVKSPFARRGAKKTFPIQSVEYVSTEEVYDITVDNASHTYWTGGLNVSNCVEINLNPVLTIDTDVLTVIANKRSKGDYIPEVTLGETFTGVAFCVSGDTKLVTREGITSIGAAVGKETEIWNGEKWCKVTPFSTGSGRKLYRVLFGDGSYLDCTDNHKFLVKDRFMRDYVEAETKDLMEVSKYAIHVPRAHVISDGGERVSGAYEYGFFVGDGKPARDVTFSQLCKDLCFELKQEELPSDVFAWDRTSVLSFIAGWMDADGFKHGTDARIYGTELRMRSLQLLLTKTGVDSSVNKMSNEGEITNLGRRKSAVWYVQIPDPRDIPTNRVDTSQGSLAKYKGKYQVIRSVEELSGLHDTYCLEEPEKHTCLFNNVMTKQCNLTEINAAKFETPEDMYEAVVAATKIGTLQADYTSFPYLGWVSEVIAEREALLGVSMTGLMDSPSIALNPEYQRKAAAIAVRTNKEFSKKIGVRPASRINCVKPAGTTSLLLGNVGSGHHPHHARRYIRRVTANELEPVFQYFRSVNPHMCVKKPNGDWVIEFPTQAPDDAIVLADVGAVEFLSMVRNTQEYWVMPGTAVPNRSPGACHNVSNTVVVKPEEWEDVEEYVWENRAYFSGTSFLPATGDKDYEYAPREAIQTEADEAKWNYLLKNYVPVDYSKMVEEEDSTDLTGELACASGACEL